MLIDAVWFSGVTRACRQHRCSSATLANRIVSTRVRRPSESEKTVSRDRLPSRMSRTRRWRTIEADVTSSLTPLTTISSATQSGAFTRSMTAESWWSKTPRRKVPGSAPSWPSSSEPRVPRYPLPVVKSVSYVFASTGSKPSSTICHPESAPSRSASMNGCLLRSGTVRREDLPLRLLAGQVHVELGAGAALRAHGVAVLAGDDVVAEFEVAEA